MTLQYVSEIWPGKDIELQYPANPENILDIWNCLLYARLHITSKTQILLFPFQIFSKMVIKVFITNISSSTDVSVLLCLQNLTFRIATPTF